MTNTNYSDSDDYQTIFNFVTFIKFLKKNNVFSLAVAAVLSAHVNKLTESFIDDIIMPIINIDINKDGNEDLKTKLENIEFNIFHIKFKTGKFLLSIIKFIIISFIIYIISINLSKIRI